MSDYKLTIMNFKISCEGSRNKIKILLLLWLRKIWNLINENTSEKDAAKLDSYHYLLSKSFHFSIHPLDLYSLVIIHVHFTILLNSTVSLSWQY